MPEFGFANEKKEFTLEKVAAYQQMIAHYYDQNVQVWQFKTRDWLLRRMNQNTRDLS